MNDINKELIEWIHAQPHWVQIAVEKIYAQKEVTDELVDELLVFLKTKEGQLKDIKIDLSGILKGSSIEAGDIRILSVSDIEGIEALAPRGALPFSPKKLSVVYGNNGSGKSGYTRILKKLCGKPNTAELQSNVFEECPQKRQCTVVVLVDGYEKRLDWDANSKPIKELYPVDFFDSQTCFSYIDKEKEVSYAPNEVLLFERLVLVFQKLQQKLKAERDPIRSKLPTKPTEFGNSKYIAGMFDLLKHDTDVAAVEDFFVFTVKDTKELDSLEDRLSASPLDLAIKKQKRITQLNLIIGQVKTASSFVSKESVRKLEKLELDVVQKRKVATQAAEAIMNETSFDGFGSDTWKDMWQAARKYSDQCAYPGKKYPVVEEAAKCILCEQDLCEAAKQRLVKFESYVTSHLESTATAAEKAYLDALVELPAKQNQSALITALQAAQLDEEKWLRVFGSIWDDIEKVVFNEKNKERVSHIHYEIPNNCFGELEGLVADLKLEIEQHNNDAKSFDRSELVKQIRELKAKKWANGYIQQIKDEISQLQKRHDIDELLKTVSTTAVSKQAGRVSEILVTDAFVNRFNEELKLLGASKVNVQLIKTQTKFGRVQHKIQLHGLNPQHNRSKALSVLSEGEQRIVSLAAFLADVSSNPNSAPLIFDDPISSLDQTYEEHTAKRLVDLSTKRQVIVFTHRLSLLGLLTEKGDTNCLHIRREPWGCGQYSDLPYFAKKPISAVRNLIDNRLIHAGKILEQNGHEEYNKLAKGICSDFRILLERIVERELLADIVARHRREVNTKNKICKLAKITLQDCELFDGLMSDFSCFEHSQSLESPIEMPNPQELDVAMKKILKWYDEFSKRKCVSQY